ncbi:MAG: hypothetical protein BYD32DRAFT_424217 [Podila humilis]|nr:MAG: hypothetical protein BYD32DRAFT_424217 [Podila humilis]
MTEHGYGAHFGSELGEEPIERACRCRSTSIHVKGLFQATSYGAKTIGGGPGRHTRHG